MYCSNCGTRISEGAGSCSACGSELRRESWETPYPARLRGFSPRINDPAFAKYVKNTNRWAAIVSIILAVAAVIGFYIAGEMGVDKLANPQGVGIGLAIGAMFLLIALLQISGRYRSKTWDGTVENKKIKRKTEQQEHTSEDYLEYSVIIRSDYGKKHAIKARNNTMLYNYFNIGDRVRHHAGLKTFEKYDKTGDKFIPCNACGKICNIDEDICPQCKCPLLK